MRAKMWKIGIVGLAVLAGWGSLVWADVAATVNPDCPGFSPLIVDGGVGYPWVTAERVYGWRFFVDKPITITHLGLFAMHRDTNGNLVDSSLSTTHTMAIWRLPKEGDFDLRCTVLIGPGATIENHYAYAPLAQPLTIVPDPLPWINPDTRQPYIDENGNPYYERWLVGVWTGTNNADLLYHGPLNAVTLDAVVAGVIRLQNYTYYYKLVNYEQIYTSDVLTLPWGGKITDGVHYFALNFKYVVGPKANAGLDVSIYTSEQAMTTIAGTATHTTPGTAMQYRWLKGGTALQDWTAVVDGAASLNLASPVPALSIGDHTLKLEVTDGTLTSSDTMILTLLNTPPVAVDDSGLTQINSAVAIDVLANDSDPDGDPLSIVAYTQGANGTVAAAEDGLTYTPSDDFVGTDTYTYTASDGKGGSDEAMVTVTIGAGTIQIDIKPGSTDNKINLGSNGVIPVALLSSANFDATTVDPGSVFLAGAGVAMRGKGNKYLATQRDVNGDGLTDLEVKVETENLNEGALQEGWAVLQIVQNPNAEPQYWIVLYDGKDKITIVPPQ